MRHYTQPSGQYDWLVLIKLHDQLITREGIISLSQVWSDRDFLLGFKGNLMTVKQQKSYIGFHFMVPNIWYHYESGGTTNYMSLIKKKFWLQKWKKKNINKLLETYNAYLIMWKNICFEPCCSAKFLFCSFAKQKSTLMLILTPMFR